MATTKTDRAPTYAEVLETAKRASAEIEATWPEWKKAWSRPEQVEIRPEPLGLRRGPVRS
jgi:hypothetical protein